MPKKKAVVFASRGSDANVYVQALRRVRCNDLKRIYSPDDISTDAPCNIAIVEIFEHGLASNGVRHVADDQSLGIRILKCIRTNWPDCVVLGISHTMCISGYAKGACFVDEECIIDDSKQDLNSALTSAKNAHSRRKRKMRRDADVVQDAQPAA